MELNEVDVYIKDERYAAVKFISLKSKEWANKNKVHNNLEHFGNSFCGCQVWYPGMKEGKYETAVEDMTKLIKLITKMQKSGLKVINEFY